MRVILADDHQLFLEGLRLLVQGMFEEVEVVNCLTIDELRKELDDSVDLVTVDLRMPGMNGVRTLKELMDRNKGVPFVVISASESSIDIEACRQSGVLGFIRKSDGSGVLETALGKIISGEKYFPPRFNLTREEQSGLFDEVPEVAISDRQHQVLRAIADNLSNQGIAEQLCISENTVKSHIKHLFAIFDASNRLECVQKARIQGLL